MRNLSRDGKLFRAPNAMEFALHFKYIIPFIKYIIPGTVTDLHESATNVKRIPIRMENTSFNFHLYMLVIHLYIYFVDLQYATFE